MILVNQSNDITEAGNSQANAARICIEKLLRKLPGTLVETAKSYGALVRRRVVKCARELILVLFIYATSDMSLRMLAASASAMGVASMSDQAWQKRVVACEPWLSCIAKETIPKFTNRQNKMFLGRSVRLLDGSNIQQAGKNGKRGGGTIRVHMCYDITEGRMGDMLVTDKHTPESVAIFFIETGVIYIADAGYGKGKNIAHIISRQADAIFRVTPNHLNLAKDGRGKSKIDMAKKLDIKADFLDFSCYVHTENRHYVPVRIVASRLPEEKALLAKERKIRSAKRRQTKKIRTATLVYAGWVILMTTLDDAYSAQDLLALYRARWQIELLFKRIKQSFDVSVLPAASLKHSKAMVLLWLILWSLTEQNALAMEICLLEKEADMTHYSPWAVQCFLFNQLKAIVNCLWAMCFDLETHALEAFQRLRNHRSSRSNQYAVFRFGC